MLRTADYIARDAFIDFTQEDMPFFRRCTVHEMKRRKLMP